MLTNPSIIDDIKTLIASARQTAIRAIDNQRTLLYWHIGERVFKEEQEGKERANYGEYIIKYLSEQLPPEFGSGFSFRQLELMRQFYKTFPIANSLRSQLSWTHYRILLRIESEDKREYYIAETVKKITHEKNKHFNNSSLSCINVM